MKAYVGGLNTGKRSVRRTAKRLSKSSGEEVRPFTYSWTVRNKDAFKATLEDCDGAITHSIGMLAVANAGVRLDTLDAVGAPLPVSRTRLFGKNVLKTIDMIARPNSGNRSINDTYIFLGGALAEILIHPFSNLRAFFNGSISHFNALDNQNIATNTKLIYGTKDEFYSREAKIAGNSDVHIVEGAKHDDILFGGAVYDDAISTR